MNKYRQHDHFVRFHMDDPDLTPITLSLPEPPTIELIDGYDMPVSEQKFHRLHIPKGLKALEEKAIEAVREDSKKNKGYVITVYKVQKKFWELLEANQGKYETEIKFIRRIWYHAVHGYWFINNRKPTYITGLHFLYLNFWTMPTNDGANRPTYRDRNRKEYIFKEYAYNCTETFAEIDHDGYAVKTNGKYEMVDLGRRICYGVIQPKNRRGGNTNMADSDSFWFLMRYGKLTDGAGFMSYSGDNAQENFKVKIVPAFKKFPIWYQPLTSNITDDEIVFSAIKNDYGMESLETKITYATTMDPRFYDSKKLVYALLDEEGKTETSIVKRWDIIKNCLAQGNGRLIHGYAYHPSTVEEMAEGANDFTYLCDSSNFYRRMQDGKSYSGLFRLFIPADEGLDDFIDEYGMSIKSQSDAINSKGAFEKSANEYLQAERDSLVKDGSPKAMLKYRHVKKLFPLKYADIFLGDVGSIGFDYEKIDKRMPYIRNGEGTMRGNFEWINGTFGGDVEFIEDNINGRFQISEKAPFRMQERIKVEMFSTFENDYVSMYAPRHKGKFVIGLDPFRFSNKKDADLVSARTGVKTRLSDGGIACLKVYDPEVDKDNSRENWVTERFVMSYRYRSRNADEFNEDALKACIYYGAMLYPEVNVEVTWEYFLRKGFAGYLIYDIDTTSGQLKDKPGVFNLETSKARLFTLLRDYIYYHGDKDNFYEFLKECKEIRGQEQMRSYDRLTAHGLALMGAQSVNYYQKMRFEDEDDGISLDNFIEVMYL